MSPPDESAPLALDKFGIGQPVPRGEDPKLLRGEGRYTDDLSLPGQLHAVIVRSRVGHGTLRGIDTAEAARMPGVRAVFTGAELDAAGYGLLKCVFDFKSRDGQPMRVPPRRALARDRVRYVGDPVACVVADTVALAKDAAEAVVVDVDPLPAVTSASAAAAPGAPLLYEGTPGNVVYDYHFGDAARVAAAFASAAHVTRLPIANNRVVVAAMEPRAAIGSVDGDGRMTLHVGSQGVFGLRNHMAELMGVTAEKFRVLTGNVGGSFGMKASVYPEYVCILHAAKLLGRPVRWTDERSESFLSDTHGRDHELVGELALDRDGNFLAVRVTGFANLGGWLAHAGVFMGSLGLTKNSIGVYRTPALEVATKAVLTNTVPINAYRGAGRPEGNYVMERLVDAAAAELGIDRVELRRRNHIRPEQMPYKAPSDVVYDSGEFTTVLERALRLADWDGFPRRQAESKARGRLRGRGIGDYLEVTAGPGKEMGGLRFDADGGVTLVTGTLDYGQGHWTPFAQVLASRLGIPFDRIRLVQGDSDALVVGGGTGGSRSMMQSGAAIVMAADDVIERGKKIASVVLEAAVADIEFARGRFTIVGTDRSVGLLELAEKLRGGLRLPPDTPTTLDTTQVSNGVAAACPNGCHVAEVEIDPETGAVEVVKYAMVNDFGTLVNPMLVEGQAHGGIVQGIGQALMERTVYDREGQFLTGSYMDYALPRAEHAPDFVFEAHSVPATTNPLGVKGCGEAGCAGSLPAVMNAVVDALGEFGIRHFDMPATPLRVWEAIRAARASR